jgi:hypothetical protein
VTRPLDPLSAECSYPYGFNRIVGSRHGPEQDAVAEPTTSSGERSFWSDERHLAPERTESLARPSRGSTLCGTLQGAVCDVFFRGVA